MDKYIFIYKKIINGKKRNIYQKNNSKKEYLKHKGRMMNLVNFIKIIKKKNSKKGGGKDLNLDIIDDYIDKAFELRERERNKLKQYEKTYKLHLENPSMRKYSFNVGKKMMASPSIKLQRYTQKSQKSQKKSKKLKTIQEEEQKNIKNIDFGAIHYRLTRF
jgi:hypothetical protein